MSSTNNGTTLEQRSGSFQWNMPHSISYSSSKLPEIVLFAGRYRCLCWKSWLDMWGTNSPILLQEWQKACKKRSSASDLEDVRRGNCGLVGGSGSLKPEMGSIATGEKADRDLVRILEVVETFLWYNFFPSYWPCSWCCSSGQLWLLHGGGQNLHVGCSFAAGILYTIHTILF